MPAERNDFENAVIAALSRWSMPISRDQLTALRAHFDAVVEANRTMNLTRITKPLEAAVKHYADSLALLWWVRGRRIKVESVVDVGTGAGLPAVPLAVMHPQWTVTAIDAAAKKIRFLDGAAQAIGLTNLRTEHAHGAHWRPARSFHMVVSRASARLPEYLEQAARVVAPNGWIVAYKTADLDRDESNAALGLLNKLGLSTEPRYPYDLELEGTLLRRALYIYRKNA